MIHLYKAPRMVKFIEAESRTTVARGWEEERMGSYCLTGIIKFQFNKMKEFWK